MISGCRPWMFGLEGGALALGLDGGVDLLLGLGDHLLDAGGVDAAVLDELFEGHARDLAPHGVEAGERDGLRRVVDDEVAAGERLDGADVAPSRPMMRPFISSLGSGTTETVISLAWSAAQRWMAVAMISRGRFPRPRPCTVASTSRTLAAISCVTSVSTLEMRYGLGLVHGVAGDLLQHLELALLDEPDLLLHAPRPGLSFWLRALGLLLKGVGLAVERLLLLLEAALLLGELRAALLDLALVLAAALVYLLAGLDQRFALLGLGGLDGLVDDPLGLLLRAGDLALGDFLAVDDAEQEAYDKHHGHTGHDAHYFPEHGIGNVPPFLCVLLKSRRAASRSPPV